MNKQLYACVDIKQNLMLARTFGYICEIPSLFVGDIDTMQEVLIHIGLSLPLVKIEALPKHFAELNKIEIHSLKEYINA